MVMVTGAKSEIATLAYMIFLFGADGEFLTEDYSKAALTLQNSLNPIPNFLPSTKYLLRVHHPTLKMITVL